MLSHRTGITRHDLIWYKSDFSRKELFERLKYLEPQEPMRQSFLYNNLMFAGVGYLIELQSGKTWEQFVRERILQPRSEERRVGKECRVRWWEDQSTDENDKGI